MSYFIKFVVGWVFLCIGLGWLIRGILMQMGVEFPETLIGRSTAQSEAGYGLLLMALGALLLPPQPQGDEK